MKKTSKPETRSWKNLAIRLRVSRTSIVAWRKLPDAPDTPDYERWKVFVGVMELGHVGNRVSRGREYLLKESLKKRNRLLDLEIARKEQKLVDRGEVEAMLIHVGTLQKSVLYAKLERELPAKGVGRTAEELAALGREFADGLAEIFANGMEEWRNAGQ